MSEPKFYSKNAVDEDSIFTVSSGPLTTPNLYDRDSETQWESVDENDDSDQVIIEVEFSEERDIDTAMLINHNLEDITLQYWDGSGYLPWASASSIATSFSKLTGTLVSTTKMKLTATQTQTPDEEKAIGELIFCALELDLGRDFKSYEIGAREKVSSNMLGDGSIHQVMTLFSTNRTQKYEARFQVQYLPEATLETYLALKEAGEPLLFQPESTQRPEQVFLVYIMGTVRYSYSDGFKSAGFTLSGDVREV